MLVFVVCCGFVSYVQARRLGVGHASSHLSGARSGASVGIVSCGTGWGPDVFPVNISGLYEFEPAEDFDPTALKVGNSELCNCFNPDAKPPGVARAGVNPVACSDAGSACQWDVSVGPETNLPFTCPPH